jgi:hypothetical protein
MGVERRGRLISRFVRASNRAAYAVWEETSGQIGSSGERVVISALVWRFGIVDRDSDPLTHRRGSAPSLD